MNNQSHTITHGVNGVICATHRSYVDSETLITFRHAVDAYGFLVKRQEKISGDEWINRIQQHFDPSARRTACINAITDSMEL